MASSDAAAVLPAGMRTMGDYEIEAGDDAPNRPAGKRGYTTRGKEEARRREVKFTGLVRRWEKRWVFMGHLRVLRWERVEADQAAEPAQQRSRGPTPFATEAGEPSRKRPRQG